MLDEHIRSLVQYRLSKICVPLLFDSSEGQGFGIAGTGSLFDLDGRTFLVTAAHIFDDVNIEEIGVPVSDPDKITLVQKDNDGRRYALNDLPIITLGSGNVGLHKKIDLALVELEDEKVILQLKNTYEFLSYDCFGKIKSKENIIIAGWPISLAEKRADRIVPKLMYYETEIIPQPPQEECTDAIESYHFFTGYEEIEEIGGAKLDPFDLQGISGGAIWQIDTSVPFNQLCTAARAMKFIGVERSARKGKFIRGTHLFALVVLFEQIDQKISAKMESMFV